MNEKRKENLKKAFALFDTDNSGEIGPDELQKVFRVLGKKLTMEECDEIIKEADEDGNGEIDFEEFCHIMERFADHSNQEKEFKELFYFFDLKGDGFIDADELYTVMNKILRERTPRRDIHEMIRIADLNEDGVIDFKEFRTTFLSLGEENFLSKRTYRRVRYVKRHIRRKKKKKRRRRRKIHSSRVRSSKNQFGKKVGATKTRRSSFLATKRSTSAIGTTRRRAKSRK